MIDDGHIHPERWIPRARGRPKAVASLNPATRRSPGVSSSTLTRAPGDVFRCAVSCPASSRICVARYAIAEEECRVIDGTNAVVVVKSMVSLGGQG